MGIFNIKKRYKLFLRYKAIANILIKHGLGFVIEKIGIFRIFNIKTKVFRILSTTENPHKMGTLAQRIKSALEELGPTFIKFGQLLSLRPDMLPENLIAELSKLQDEVEPFAFEKVVSIIESEYQRPAGDFFSEITPEPIGSASIAQVHKAILLNGEKVIIKVRRPDIEKTIESDIEILFNFAKMLANRFPEIRLYEPVRMVGEFARHIRREIDFSIEAQNCERFYKNFENDATIHIPKVYQSFTTARLLVLEYMSGVKADRVDELKALGFDLKAIAHNGASAFFKMVLIDGLFHGDPHPGNVFIRYDGTIAFIDFGITGKLTEEHQTRVVNMFLGLMTRDSDKILKNLLVMGVMPDNIDIGLLKYEIDEFIDDYYGRPLKNIELGKVMLQTIKIAVRHKIRVPAEYSLLSKATMEIEAIGRNLDPEFEANKIAGPFIKEITKKLLWPQNFSKFFINFAEDIKEFVTESPRSFNSIIKKVEKGKLAIEFHHIGLEELINKLDSVSSRISVSLIISAIIVASGFIVMTGRGPMVYGIPTLGLIGFVTAGFLGIILIISVFRSGRL
ncbi:MAG TPA: AarF/ABC1/UbiB kinase family protein [Candidatus Wallbacteria bacterium]|nr:AarF/ABC1/UbiB kinase family protein [Candidatus Wallbacteria bacterium]